MGPTPCYWTPYKPDSYLDHRRPEWASDERRGFVRYFASELGGFVHVHAWHAKRIVDALGAENAVAPARPTPEPDSILPDPASRRSPIMIECPHCYTRGLVLADNLCPSCRRNVSDTAGTDPSRTSIVIAEAARLPDRCCGCGAPTQRRVRVERARTRPDVPSSSNFVLLMLVNLWAALLWWFVRQTLRDYVAVRLPQCHKCAKGGKPEPVYVDFDRGDMTFIVHRSLRDAAQGGGVR